MSRTILQKKGKFTNESCFIEHSGSIVIHIFRFFCLLKIFIYYFQLTIAPTKLVQIGLYKYLFVNICLVYIEFNINELYHGGRLLQSRWTRTIQLIQYLMQEKKTNCIIYRTKEHVLVLYPVCVEYINTVRTYCAYQTVQCTVYIVYTIVYTLYSVTIKQSFHAVNNIYNL